jgi:hypothetical protein
MADKISNDEAQALEATGSDEKYRAALHDRAEAAGKLCLETVRKNLAKPD